MWQSTSDCSSIKIHGKFNPEDVEKWINQLMIVKLPYLKLDTILSTLKEIADSENSLSPEIVTKLKMAVLFGDISEYVEFSSPSRSSYESKNSTLMGIPKEFLAAQNLALTENERTTVVDFVEKKLQENIRSILKIFKLESGEGKILETERIKQVPTQLESFVNAHRSTELMLKFYDRYRDKLERCQREIMHMGDTTRRVVDMRINTITPSLTEILKIVKNRNELLQLSSRIQSATVKKNIFTPDTIEALKMITSEQKDEIEQKEDQIETLKKQTAEYENLHSEGFESLLEEYLVVEKALKTTQSTLKAFKSNSLNDSSDS